MLESIWSSVLPQQAQCATTEVDVSGLSGMFMLEWLVEHADACAAVGHRAAN
jgi:hypothetical protein